MKILHILDHYKPHFSGYVFRSSYIMKHQREFGLEPVIVTSPKHGNTEKPLEEIDNIRIYSTQQNNFGNMPFIKEVRLMKALQKRIEKIISKENPDIIHAHSPSLNGISALRAGKKYGVPVVYEVRALWEDAAVDHGTFKGSSFKYSASRFVETQLFKRADALFAICNGLKNEIVSRGIPGDKVTVIQNCVDTKIFSPSKYDEEITHRYGLKGNLVIGFIGSFYKYEGIDILIDSYVKVLKKRNDVKLLLVGDGPEKNTLHRKSIESNLNSKVIFTGKVPHEEIKKYYSVIDILVYPRKSIRLTELVTPLKPLEAMAMGKVVVGSDVGGIKELITDSKDGFLFQAGDVYALSALLAELAVDRKGFSEVSNTAIETVKRKHKWGSAIKKYLPVYERIRC